MTIKEIMQETDLIELYETMQDINSDMAILHKQKNDPNHDYHEVIGNERPISVVRCRQRQGCRPQGNRSS